MASIQMAPIIWAGRRYTANDEEDFGDGVGELSFDPEAFVAQLVEDDEPLQRSGIEDRTREAPMVAGDDFVPAKPYMNSIFSWPDSRREAGAQGEAHGGNHRGIPPSSITVPADLSPGPPRLFDVDLFSGEYEDEQYSFLRKLELVRFVGQGYVVKPGKPGVGFEGPCCCSGSIGQCSTVVCRMLRPCGKRSRSILVHW